MSTGVAPEADAIVDDWLAGLPSETDGRSGGVRDEYRALAHVVLRHGLSCSAATPETYRPELDDLPELEKALASVAAATRLAGLRISETVDDLARLEVAVLDWLRRRAADSNDWPATLAQSTRIALSLGAVTRRLVHVLEETGLRSQRESSDALAAMTDMLSHELGNRLGAALTASEMLLSPSIHLGDDGLARAAELVRASVDAALQTVDDVRALAASRSRLRQPPSRRVDLAQLIHSVADRQRSAAREVGVQIEIGPGVDDCGVDLARLRLVISNLLSNGVKYHDPDKEARFVRIESEWRGPFVEIRVCDNGIGVAPEDLDDIFLYRVRGSDAEYTPGSGLGLAIVREAVQQVGGSIAVDSESGTGACFTVSLPVVARG